MKKQEEVLFIVYRPEWWGCFDSLCRQECSRTNVTCHVMLIPRYDRDLITKKVNPAAKHFCPEMLTELPPEVIVEDYRNFFPKQRFDRIYIHNPYDNTNAMDSAYYSGNLKALTDRLIYVPHLLYMGGLPETMKCCKAYQNVDAIFLSDERVRYTLEQEYEDKVELVSDGITDYLERLNVKKNENATTDKDGKRRLLYCVSFDDLFYGTEKQIRKMWDIFHCMEERKDIVFVFRPDEDIPSRAYELDPEIYRQYRELVAYFKERNIGIYDETPDPYRAAVEADGIMTAGHPLSAMFSVQGKPVLYVDREHRANPTEEEMCIPNLWTMTAAETGEGTEVWFAPAKSRLLCRMSLYGEKSGETEIVAEIPDEPLEWMNYADIIKTEDCLYLSPYGTDGIWKYELGSGKFSKQYLPELTERNITRTILYGEYLYLIPRTYPGILKYHMPSGEIRLIDGWVKEMDDMAAPEYKKSPYFIWAVEQEANRLYLAAAKCDAWMELDMDTDSWTLRCMNLPGGRFIDMVKDGAWVWLLPFDGQEIIRWNCETGESQTVFVTEKAEPRLSPYEFLLDCGEELIAFPKRENRLLVIPKKGGAVREIKEGLPCGQKDYASEFMAQSRIGYQFVKKLGDGRILAYEYYDGAFLLLDKELRLLEKLPCRLPLEAVRRQQNILWEKELCRSGFSGCLHEGYSPAAMLDFFVENTDKFRREIAAEAASHLKRR